MSQRQLIIQHEREPEMKNTSIILDNGPIINIKGTVFEIIKEWVNKE